MKIFDDFEHDPDPDTGEVLSYFTGVGETYRFGLEEPGNPDTFLETNVPVGIRP